MKKNRRPEFRAADATPKALSEQRADIINEMQGIISSARAEARAFSEEEDSRMAEYESRINAIDRTLAAEQRAMSLFTAPPSASPEPEQRAANEIINDFVRGKELRANEMSVSSTGGIVPSEFSSDIVKTVTELSGIYNLVGKVRSKGVYKQIIRNSKIASSAAPELSAANLSTTDFTTIEIGHHKYMAEVVMSLEVINQTVFDLTSEVMTQFSEDFALKAETSIIKGSGTDEATGLVKGGTKFDLAAADVITADEIIKAYHALKTFYRNNAAWIMSNDTLCSVRLLKDGNGQYMFHQSELSSGYAGTILGMAEKSYHCRNCAYKIAECIKEHKQRNRAAKVRSG